MAFVLNSVSVGSKVVLFSASNASSFCQWPSGNNSRSFSQRRGEKCPRTFFQVKASFEADGRAAATPTEHKLVEEIDMLRKSLAAAEDSAKRAALERDSYVSYITTLQEQLHAKDAYIYEIQDPAWQSNQTEVVEKLQAKVKQLQEQVDESESRIMMLSAESGTCSNDLASQERAFSAERESYLQFIADLQKSVHEKESEIEGLTERLAAAEAALSQVPSASFATS
mmetsp:Transcript_13623/g.23336  ORF Transcript_13623/g.23336 Transcript_13623/m.23336 type:complete len:226 (-) Transcript_13623:491-1168(-)|eukprot:CAMPEP_0196659502 /NCGR_PEP_ID=MMETSP1086-20130531/35337_1 /TAXON_ID=77921 /ORGANISM="Cyanoptyche  gloeocystis , Strain SAG4.97" /LENGTH=225 /DNA_ID=CAMNT_0041993517 /DNA_START=76 /DNA_END=753 /DNA_ORIENTATION=-